LNPRTAAAAPRAMPRYGANRVAAAAKNARRVEFSNAELPEAATAPRRTSSRATRAAAAA